MQLPMVHMNGSSRSDLVAQYTAAYEAVQEALRALHKIETHGRDYYRISEDAGTTARREHAARVAAVQAVLHDLETLALHCQSTPSGAVPAPATAS